MAVKRAKVIEKSDVKKVLDVIKTRNTPLRDTVALFLGLKGGLRVAEIAGLRWDDVLKSNGEIADFIFIGSHIGKGKKERQVPMHKDLKPLLAQLRRNRPNDEHIVHGLYKDSVTPNALTVWFKRLFEEADLIGCSSHSPRRTLITNLARNANLHGGSLKDVQAIAGHSFLVTTERYIEPSEAQIDMVNNS